MLKERFKPGAVHHFKCDFFKAFMMPNNLKLIKTSVTI